MEQNNTVTYNNLEATWPSVFGINGIVRTESVDDIFERAFLTELITCGDTGKPELRISFLYQEGETYTAFKDGADTVILLAPTEYTPRMIDLDTGDIICIMDLQWSDDEEEE